MKLKELHALMQDMQPFAEPKIELEQYPTGPDIASRMLYTIESMYNDFEGKVVADLGCGTVSASPETKNSIASCTMYLFKKIREWPATCQSAVHEGQAMLGVGAALLGSPAVIGVDIDADALEVAQVNCDQFEDHVPIDFMLCDVQQLHLQHRLRADTVIMNPPFGTRSKGADMAFLRAAVAVCDHAIYSLHKSSTRAHIQKIATRELQCQSAEVLAELRYNLPATYKFHKQKTVDIAVDLWRFVVQERAADTSQGRSPQVEGTGHTTSSNDSDDDAS